MYFSPSITPVKYGTARAVTVRRSASGASRMFRVLLPMAENPYDALNGKLDPNVVLGFTDLTEDMVLTYGTQMSTSHEFNKVLPETVQGTLEVQFDGWEHTAFPQMPVKVAEYDWLVIHAIIDVRNGSIVTSISNRRWPLDLVWSVPAPLEIDAKGARALRQMRAIRDTYTIIRS